MNKHLEAKMEEVKAGYFSGLSYEENLFTSAPIHLKTIYNIVTCESRRAMHSYEKLCISLATEGMKHPCIIIENTPENYERACYGVKESYISTKSMENEKWLALTGNSRITFANDYEYNFVDCFIVDSFIYMHAIQLILQNGVIEHDISA